MFQRHRRAAHRETHRETSHRVGNRTRMQQSAEQWAHRSQEGRRHALPAPFRFLTAYYLTGTSGFIIRSRELESPAADWKAGDGVAFRTTPLPASSWVLFFVCLIESQTSSQGKVTVSSLASVCMSIMDNEKWVFVERPDGPLAAVPSGEESAAHSDTGLESRGTGQSLVSDRPFPTLIPACCLVSHGVFWVPRLFYSHGISGLTSCGLFPRYVVIPPHWCCWNPAKGSRVTAQESSSQFS